jgi:hypothetical protein
VKLGRPSKLIPEAIAVRFGIGTDRNSELIAVTIYNLNI